ncbi:triacylglycerol lipase [Ancylostoma ceylanicum]|uniref:Triacylglycerol lipase n=1 Tax=Ancylostoma ceylanicum TaxID=53326 RepID=A0A0D6M5F6_9BILA|nr:triacylglycerol lipase [Ancylostoma ceylanicum]
MPNQLRDEVGIADDISRQPLSAGVEDRTPSDVRIRTPSDVGKATKILFTIFRSVHTKDPNTLVPLYKTSDLGSSGSFGGRADVNDSIVHDPVIFVHGVSDVAGLKMQAVSNQYKAAGYTDSELYSTSYANGARLNPLQWTLYSMKCEYVKQIRALILAVRYYARKNVDIVAFSLGVPIARKAILGGRCVDTNEDLGGPLTRYVDTFLGIAGPNHGITLKDINRNHHYEGKAVFSIYSHIDDRIGYKVCDKNRETAVLSESKVKVTASITGEDGHKSFRNLNHDDTLDTTHQLQISMIQGHFGEGLKSEPREKEDEEDRPRNNATKPLDIGDLSVSDMAVDNSVPVDVLPKVEFFDNSSEINMDRIRRKLSEHQMYISNENKVE